MFERLPRTTAMDFYVPQSDGDAADIDSDKMMTTVPSNASYEITIIIQKFAAHVKVLGPTNRNTILCAPLFHLECFFLDPCSPPSILSNIIFIRSTLTTPTKRQTTTARHRRSWRLPGWMDSSALRAAHKLTVAISSAGTLRSLFSWQYLYEFRFLQHGMRRYIPLCIPFMPT